MAFLQGRPPRGSGPPPRPVSFSAACSQRSPQTCRSCISTSICLVSLTLTPSPTGRDADPSNQEDLDDDESVDGGDPREGREDQSANRKVRRRQDRWLGGALRDERRVRLGGHVLEVPLESRDEPEGTRRQERVVEPGGPLGVRPRQPQGAPPPRRVHAEGTDPP